MIYSQIKLTVSLLGSLESLPSIVVINNFDLHYKIRIEDDRTNNTKQNYDTYYLAIW